MGKTLAKALYPSALVIDGNQQGIRRGLADFCDQCRDLFRTLVIAAEKDHASCRRVCKARPVLTGQHEAVHIEHDLAAYRERIVVVSHGWWSLL